MQNRKHPIDELFREQLIHGNITPTQNHWEKINQHLQTNAKRKKNYRPFLAAASVILLAVMLWNYFPQKNQKDMALPVLKSGTDIQKKSMQEDVLEILTPQKTVFSIKEVAKQSMIHVPNETKAKFHPEKISARSETMVVENIPQEATKEQKLLPETKALEYESPPMTTKNSYTFAPLLLEEVEQEMALEEINSSRVNKIVAWLGKKKDSTQRSNKK